MITDEQILEYAEKYLDVFPDDVTATKKQLIEFALKIHEMGYNEGYDEGWESRAQSEHMNSSYPTGLVKDPQ